MRSAPHHAPIRGRAKPRHRLPRHNPRSVRGRRRRPQHVRRLGPEDRPGQDRQDPRPQRNLRADAPQPRSQPPHPATGLRRCRRPASARRAAPRLENSPPQAPPAAPGVRGFRDIAADADDLGRAAAQANRAARKTYANVPSPSPEFDRLEPSMENRGADPDAPYSYDEFAEEGGRALRAAAAAFPRVAGPASRRNAAPAPCFRSRARSRSAFVLILVGAGIPCGQVLAISTVSGLFKSSTTVVEAPKDSSTPVSKPKIPDRVGQPSSSDQVAPVAQRVVLYDEDPADPKGKQYVGSVVWRTEPIKAAAGQPADIAVRADIEIPDRKFKMTMSFRRNTDTSLPASHTAELTFILPSDFAGGGVSNVPGLLMKSNEQARGTPLAASPSRSPTASSWSGCRMSRPTRAQHPASEGALLVRCAAGVCQPAPRHHRHREGPAGRARLQRSLRGLGRVGAGAMTPSVAGARGPCTESRSDR